MLRQQRHVEQPLAQRRQLDRENVQPIQQVLAQLADPHRILRNPIRRRDDAHIGILRLGRADAHETPGLEHPQQLDLQIHRHLGDLVEKQRAAAGALEETLVLAVGAGEAALLVAEDFAFDQIGRDRTAIDREKRPRAAPAEVVHRLRDDLLAAAAFAGDEDRDTGRRHPRDLFIDAQHRVGPTPQVAEMPVRRHFRAQVRHLGLQLGRLHEARQHRAQMVRIDRLDEVVGGSEAQRLDRGLEAGMAGDQHHL